MIATQIATIDVHVPAALYGDFAADFDTVAVDRDYRDALEAAAQELVASVRIAANGMVFCDSADVDAAQAIDWRELDREIDITPILQSNEL